MTIKQLRATTEFRQTLERLAFFFTIRPDVRDEAKKLSYHGMNLATINAIKEAGPTRYNTYSGGDAQTYHLFEEFYDVVLSCYPLLEKVAAGNRNKLLLGMLIATLSGSILDHDIIFSNRNYQWSFYSCIQRGVSVNNLRKLIKYNVGVDFVWHYDTKAVPENVIKFFKENEVPAVHYWRMCSSIAQYAFNPVLLRHALKDVLGFCEVKNTPEHRGLEAGAANRLDNKYHSLGIATASSVTDYIRAATNKGEAIEQLLQLCRDTERMYYEVPGHYRYCDPRLKLSIKDIRAEHDRLIPLYNAELAQQRINRAARQQRRATDRDIELAQLNSPITDHAFTPKELFTAEYKVILPKTRTEIVEEGAAMGHCVASYAGRHACEDHYNPGSYMFIMFVRTLEDERIATVEVRYTETNDLFAYQIVQIRGKFNKTNELISQIKDDLTNYLNK